MPRGISESMSIVQEAFGYKPSSGYWLGATPMSRGISKSMSIVQGAFGHKPSNGHR